MSEQTREELLAKIAEIRDDVSNLQAQLDDAEDELRELRDEKEDRGGPTVIEAVDAFCECCLAARWPIRLHHPTDLRSQPRHSRPVRCHQSEPLT